MVLDMDWTDGVSSIRVNKHLMVPQVGQILPSAENTDEWDTFPALTELII